MSDKGLKFYRRDQSALKSNCIPGCVIQYEFSQFIFCFLFYFFKEAYENSVVIIDLKNLVVNKQMVCCRPRSVVPTKGLFRLIHGFVLSL